VFIAATRAAGQAVAMAAIASKIAMDAERVRFTLDGSREPDRRLLAELYRHARVLSHVTDDDQISVEADVPRRLMPRFRRGRVQA
jgi:50S ribosomal subunit-associated GTPase HflX